MDQKRDFPGVDHAYHCGLVADVFRREREARFRGYGYGPVVSAWMFYEGGEVAPFEAYMRWARDGSFVTLATIMAEDQRRGRMPIIMDALEGMSPEVRVESVGNPHLSRWLHRRGYVIAPSCGFTDLPEGWPGDWKKIVK